MSDGNFANGAPMDISAAEQAHRRMYPHLYAPHQAKHRRPQTAEEIAAAWKLEAAALAEFEQLTCGPDRDRPAGRL